MLVATYNKVTIFAMKIALELELELESSFTSFSDLVLPKSGTKSGIYGTGYYTIFCDISDTVLY